MRHARAEALDRLEPLLAQLRQLDVAREKSRGVFYRGSKAFLHFHEEGDELYADVRFAEDFERLNVTSAEDHARLLERLRSMI
jgi:hypothetical protein